MMSLDDCRIYVIFPIMAQNVGIFKTTITIIMMITSFLMLKIENYARSVIPDRTS